MSELWLSNPRRRRKSRNPARRKYKRRNPGYFTKGRRRRNPIHYRRTSRRRSYRRHNPPIVESLMIALQGAVGYLGTGILAPKVTSLVGIAPSGIWDGVTKAAIAWLGGTLLQRFNPSWGKMFTVGGMISVLTPILQTRFGLGEYSYMPESMVIPGVTIPPQAAMATSMNTSIEPGNEQGTDFGWVPERLQSRWMS